MNNLQSGVTASDLSPQNFKNSSQEGAVQRTDDLSSSQASQGGLPTINNLPSDINLKVVDGSQDQTVLGLSSVAQTTTQEPTIKSQNSSSATPLIAIVLVVAAISIYLFRKFFEFAPAEETKD